MKRYLLVTNRSWNIETFLSWRERLDGRWQICVTPQDLESIADSARPRYVFFPHWSHIVPAKILTAHECVCFHMTDVPYGRGGSPLQNLIERGHQETVLTALRMTSEIDAGPYYLKRPLSLEGTAEEIFRRAAELGMDMIREIVAREPTPNPQAGTPVSFKRRQCRQSKLPKDGTLNRLFDHIRMLDAPGYPHAFLEYGDWRGTITDARLKGDAVEASIRFSTSRHKER